ncbi:MAG TPA: carboxypeptidase regulatory-like domain-containing protein [Gemmatimonadales bacterium]|nr:carboxypeptidase regulatory-like domain-containing protein [Gemmatimonadales bacterium]
MRSIVGAPRAWVAAIVFSMVAAAAVRAQGVTTGAITGRVTDTGGRPIALAEVRIVNRSTGYTTSTRTRENGLFLVQGLEVGGPYTVVVRAIGHQPSQRNDVDVGLSEATRVDVQLTPQAVELEAVVVPGGVTPDFSPTRQGVGTQISDSLVRRIPTFSRDFIDQLKLSPQVVAVPNAAPSGGGAYNRFNTITVDGANQSERFNLAATNGVPGGSASGKIVSLDAVKEFRIVFTPSDVRQGNFAGMLVNAVTKSGTNEFHGGASYTYRSNSDVLGLNLVGQDLRAAPLDVKQYSLYLGGPIVRDRLHFFVATEFQEKTVPATGPYYLNGQPSPAPNAPAVSLDSLNLIATIMQSTYNFNVGASTPVNNDTPLRNLFGRIDFQISPAHRLVVRQIINHDEDDSFSRNIATYNNSPLNQNSGYRFSSNGFSRVAKNNSTTGQLYSNFANGWSNELIVGYSTINDQRNVPVKAPEVGVGVNTGGTVRAVTFGTEQFSPNNLLDQKIFEAVNNLTIPKGQHTFTLGGRLDFTHIFNNFAQGSYGVYTFPTIAALQAGTPSGYAVGYANSQNPADIPADFHVHMYSLYGQDQWNVTERLAVTAGLRADIPSFPDRPSQNDTLTNALAAAGLTGIRTDVVPKTRVLFSPRLGFNYDPTGDQRNQIRGSVGIFTGPPPYILLGNAFANTGLGLVRLSCTGAQTPAFTVDINALPKACTGQPVPGPGQAGTVGVNLTDPNFKYPQYFGVSAGFDRQLPNNWVVTVEGMYRKAINGVLIRDLDIKGPRMVGGVPYTDRDGRVLYADTINANGSVPFSSTNLNGRWLDSLRHVAFTEGIIEVTNQSKDFNYSASAQLNHRFSDRFEATVAYTYTKSEDVQSLTSDRAISNWRNGRQLSNAHDDLVTAPSVFSRPDRVIAYGTYTLPWQKATTDITLYYEHSSGFPISYVASGDLNGDGYNGNDLLYIPRDATDPNEIRIGTGVNAAFVQNLPAAKAFQRFIDAQPCLAKQRGQIMKRDSCRSPAQNRIDLSIRQAVPQYRGHQFAVQLDIFNFLNFLNKNWGQVKLPTLSPTFPDQRALIQTGRNAGPLNQSIPTFTFDNRLYDATTGDPKPFEGRLSSVYQIQLSLRYTF